MHLEHIKRPFICMKHHRSGARRMVETRVAGFEERFCVLPPGGWVRTVRDALGMSSYQLASRMGFSQTRVRQFEHGEVDGWIRLSALRRAAEALHCRLVYVFLPKEPLEDIVLRQAYLKAAAALGILAADGLSDEDSDSVPLHLIDQLEDLTMHYVDHRDLWS